MTRTDRAWVSTQVAFLIAIALALIFLRRPEEPILPVWVGVALTLVSLILFVASFVAHVMVNRTIQVNVCPSPDPEKRLVARGIYAYIRHPMYLSAAVLLLGAATWHGNPVVIGGGLAATLFVYLKSIHEEKLLLQVYADYPDYMRRTGRLLPRLWK